MTDKLLDFNKKREESIEQKRRSFERIFFNNTLGAYSVVDQNSSIFPIELIDISYDGCLFQIPWNVKRDKKMPLDTELNLRMYFTKHSFIPVVVWPKYARESIDQNGHTYMQYGCEFDKSYPTFESLKSFIDFMYKFAEFSVIDHGDSKVYFL